MRNLTPSTTSLTSPTASSFPFYAPVHLSRVRRGCWAAVSWQHSNSKARQLFERWKGAPSLNPDITQLMAGELGRLIRECLPVLPHNWLLTAPPQGKSSFEGREYPAGFLAQAVATQLDLEYVVCFAPAPRRSRGRFESIRRTEPFRLVYVPDVPVIVIDDMCTSGRTLRTALDTLADAGIVSFGFTYATSG